MLRNREVRQLSLWLALITVVAAGLGFANNTAAGIFALVLAAAFCVIFFIFTRARYRSIAQISEQINLVLHNEDHLYIVESDEGELSILQSEITKMMLRIREQNEALKGEKEHLATSLADIAHQLRTPLTSANLILSLLANSSIEDERKAFVRETEDLLLRMDGLITSLLKLSRLDAGIVMFQNEQININSLINNALRPFLIQMELRHIHVRIEVENGLFILGDPVWLSEALQNIIKNGIENAGENGKLSILCEANPLFTEITIHDNGKGFEKEDLPCLFDRYYRGKNHNAAGFGIGLALCKMVISRQGGTITAKNHPQGGAVFAIRFPK